LISAIIDRIHFSNNYHEDKDIFVREITNFIETEVKYKSKEIEGCISLIGWMLQSKDYCNLPTRKKTELAKKIYRELVDELSK